MKPRLVFSFSQTKDFKEKRDEACLTKNNNKNIVFCFLLEFQAILILARLLVFNGGIF